MKKYQIKVKGLQLEIIQDDDNNFIIPDYIKQQEQFGTALKPSYEPIIVARKPFKGSLIENIIENGVGGINIDECRVGMSEDDKQQYYDKQKSFENTYQNKESIYGGNSLQKSKTSFYDINTLTKKTLNQGRFPANTILTYDETDYDEVCDGMPYTKSTGGSGESSTKNTFSNVYNGGWGHDVECSHLGGLGDSGSASRYFYCAKASRKDRDEGLEEFEIKQTGELQGGRKEGSAGSLRIRDNGSIGENPYAENGAPKRNIHPTVKPTSLMQYLVRLVTPKDGVILDPFMGSGSTGKAVMFENNERQANYKFIGIEKEKEYCDIAKARIQWASSEYVYINDDEKSLNFKIDEIKKKNNKSKEIRLW